jgi:GNAT superfamily N-acetyltransferase
VERGEPRSAELHRLYVHPGLRRRGLGLLLTTRVMDWCRAAGIPHLLLWSDTRFDRAHALYTRLGFARTGEREVPGDVNGTREFRFDLDL